MYCLLLFIHVPFVLNHFYTSFLPVYRYSYGRLGAGGVDSKNIIIVLDILHILTLILFVPGQFNWTGKETVFTMSLIHQLVKSAEAQLH